MEAEAAVVYIAHKTYVVRRYGPYWTFTNLASGEEYVSSREGCTCEDSKFRGRVCKHSKALGALL